MDISRATVIGNVTRDPETRHTANGDAIRTFSVATKHRVRDASKPDAFTEATSFHNVTCFGKLGDVVEQYVRKGSKLYVEGNLRSQQYTGRDGVKRTSWQIIASQVLFLDPKSGGVGAKADEALEHTEPAPPDMSAVLEEHGFESVS